jgi:ferredoxin
MIHRVHFRRENVTVHAAEGQDLRRIAIDNDIDLYPVLGGKLSCHGKGFCGTCLVEVDDPAQLAAPTKREAKWLKGHHPGAANLRLACQAQLKGSCIVTSDPDTKPGWETHTYYSGRIVRTWEQVKAAQKPAAEAAQPTAPQPAAPA